MHVGKRTKSILAVLLIFGILVVSIPSRAIAAGPVALAPAVKYAIGAGLVAAGVYAGDKQSLDTLIQETWNNLSESSKRQWNAVVATGSMVGHIVLTNDMWQNLIDSISTIGINTGNNTITLEGKFETYNSTKKYRTLILDGDVYEIKFEQDKDFPRYYHPAIAKNGVIVAVSRDRNTMDVLNDIDRCYIVPSKDGSSWRVVVHFWTSPFWSQLYYYLNKSELTQILGKANDEIINVIGSATVANPLRDYVNNRTNQRTIEVPPVPPDVWDDRWIDNLEKELNRTDNPAIDETTIQQEEVEWWIDKDGNIYKQPKGTPPRRDGDVKLIPPLTIPEIPENPPDRITEREIESPEITEVPHPTKPDTYIRTTTRTIERTTTSTDIETGRTIRTIETIIRTTVEEVTYARDGVPLPEPDVELIEETETEKKPPRTEVTTDDTTINWEPLRRGLYELTEKFPFCLPWDLMRGIQSLEANQWDRQIRINVGDGIWPEMVIDLTIFDEIARITRVVLLVVFDLGLIFATRRLMGGDV